MTMCVWNRVRVKVQRGLDSSVSQLLLRDLGGYADVVRDGSVDVTKLRRQQQGARLLLMDFEFTVWKGPMHFT